MAQRRMFSPSIVNSDAFLEMPPSTQALYFQLGMKADDDGFVNPKMVMRMMGSSDDELRVLVAKRFVLPFDNGVLVIKHWKVNNLVRKDWYRPTMYVEEKKQLFMKENGVYTDNPQEGKPLVNDSATQVRLGKVSLDKTGETSSPSNSTNNDFSVEECDEDGNPIINAGKRKVVKKENWTYQQELDALRRSKLPANKLFLHYLTYRSEKIKTQGEYEILANSMRKPIQDLVKAGINPQIFEACMEMAEQVKPDGWDIYTVRHVYPKIKQNL